MCQFFAPTDIVCFFSVSRIMAQAMAGAGPVDAWSALSRASQRDFGSNDPPACECNIWKIQVIRLVCQNQVTEL